MANWQIDPTHTTGEFKVQHAGVSWIPGYIRGVVGEIEFDPANPTAAKFSAELDLNTLDTGFGPRDGHLKSPDFFDVAKFPKLKYESASVEAIDATHFKVKGKLTIKDTTKDVELEGEFLGESDKPDMEGGMARVSAFTLKTQLDRRDYGLNWNVEIPGGKLLVGNEVFITVDVEAIKK